VWHRNLYLEFVISFILLSKAVFGCFWYHYYAKANRVDLTAELYLIRLAWDSLIIISAVLYFIFTPNVLTVPQLSILLFIVIGAEATIGYTCVWRAHEKLK